MKKNETVKLRISRAYWALRKRQEIKKRLEQRFPCCLGHKNKARASPSKKKQMFED